MPSSEPLLLAIDTSTEVAGIGLAAGEWSAEIIWPAGRMQTTSVLVEIDALLARCGRTIEDVSAVAVAIGPGTFTGLRVGLSVAKGLVLARDVSLIGVPTLSVTAAPFLDAGIGVLAVLPAGRGRVVCAMMVPDGAAIEHRNVTFEEFAAEAESLDLLVVGELSGEQRAVLAARGVALARAAASVRRPALLAGLAMDRLMNGDVDDPATLEPRYVHGVRVTTKPVIDRLRRQP